MHPLENNNIIILKNQVKIYAIIKCKKGDDNMLPSEELRQEVSQEHRINLEQYAWTPELKETIFDIDLDKETEPSLDKLGEAYLYGLNIGHCGLTSRYIVRNFDNARLYYGKANLLSGTPSSPNGEHSWTTLDGYLIDTTLMISFPEEKRVELGYITEKEIAQQAARILSEYDTYESELVYQYIKK